MALGEHDGDMPTLTVRNLSADEHAALRVRAAEHGRSMEAEARALIRSGLDPKPATSVKERVEQAQARVRSMFHGNVPVGLVDDFIADRRAAAARGE